VLRIGIDCRLAGLSHAGIGRYISSFVPKVLSLLQDEAEVVLFCSTKEQARDLCFAKSPRIEIVIAPYKHYSLAEQTVFLSVLNKQKLDLLHVPHFNVPYFYAGTFVVTIHDLLWHKQRGLQVTTLNPVVYWLKYFFYTHIVARAVSRAKKIFVPSQTIATELAATYPIAKEKTVVTYEGVGDSLLKVQLPTLARKTNTLLYVGSLYPHKNIAIVLQLLQQHPELKLEVVTARSAFVKRVKQQITALKVQNQVQFFLSIDDRALAKRYREATALIQPSFSEGFGLTGLEALMQNTPVLASDIPIFHEIYQAYATFFDPRNITSLETAWNSVATHKQEVTLPDNFSKRYNWDTLAKQTLDVYRNALT